MACHARTAVSWWGQWEQSRQRSPLGVATDCISDQARERGEGASGVCRQAGSEHCDTAVSPRIATC